MKKQSFAYSIVLYIVAVFYLASTTPIGPHEAKIFYTSHDIVSILMHFGDNIVPNFLGLRIVFMLFGFLSIWIFYKLSEQHFQQKSDTYLSTVIFMLLPGILTALTLANVAIIVLMVVLLFVWLYEKEYYWPLPLLMTILFFIHEASIIFFIALLIYGISHKDKKMVLGASVFLVAFIYLAKGIEIGGRPSGHFIDIFGLYATVFSPLLFIYFFYAMYRILLREKKTFIWYISFTALAFSLLLSLRQRVYVTDFAPYVLIAIIPMLKIYNQSVRVRLPEFQKYYKMGFYIVMFFLVFSTLLVVFNKATFDLLNNSETHFASRIYKPYYLAKELKLKGVHCHKKTGKRELYQLQYYDILPCQNE